MMQRRLFRFTYPVQTRRQIYPFQVRDGEAALHLTAPLGDLGYRYAGQILNYPSDGQGPIPADHHLVYPDLLLLTTRPPMHDMIVGDKKGFRPSFTTLEDKLFQGPLGERFERSARSEILLTEETASISPEIAKRRSIIFRQNGGGAAYKSYGSGMGEWTRFKERPALTAAFLLYAEHAWPGGPGFLAAFGMSGTETLVWCYQLATRFSHLLCTTPFAMAEMRTGELPERPGSIDFADSWEITILGAAKPAPTSGPKRAA
jgi:hypothetical protein